MVGKKSGRALLREEGLERTDNEMDLSTWPQVSMINQKNYYTDYLKRDDQLLALRKAVEEQRERLATILRNRDREAALANGFGTADSNDVRSQDGRPKGEDGETDSEGATAVPGSDTIVIHLGSQNMRIGVASDALPKTVPMVIAKKWHECEAEEGDASPSPKRRKVEFSEKNRPEKLFGSDFNQRMIGASADFKTRMRNNKLRLMPNSKELVISYNKKVRPDIIHEHNDAGRIIFTEYQDPEEGKPIATFTGSAALRIPDYSEPRYKLFWPIRQGWLNEKDYDSRRIILADIVHIIEQTLKQELRIGARDCRRYSCVFVIPDLYERQYVVNLIDLLLRDISFSRVSVIQESLAATFGAGYAQACVIDIGAAKTSVCCVDEGMCIEPSRMNLKYGGADVTSTLMKMLLYDYFPYDEINLKRRYDWLLAEELKKKICTMSEPEITVQLFDFHLRAFGQDTRKYSFKTYEEVILAQLSVYNTDFIDNSGKLDRRRALLPRSADVYDNTPSETQSAAQSALIIRLLPSESLVPATSAAPSVANSKPAKAGNGPTDGKMDLDEPSDKSAVVTNGHKSDPPPPYTEYPENPAPQDGQPGKPLAEEVPSGPTAAQLDSVLPIMRLDAAVFSSVEHAAPDDDRRQRDLLGSIMLVGGGSMTPGFANALEERLKEMRPHLAKDILVGVPPRELDAQVVCWKGASVFAKLSNSNDSWISQVEWDRLGSRVLAYKCLFAF